MLWNCEGSCHGRLGEWSSSKPVLAENWTHQTLLSFPIALVQAVLYTYNKSSTSKAKLTGGCRSRSSHSCFEALRTCLLFFWVLLGTTRKMRWSILKKWKLFYSWLQRWISLTMENAEHNFNMQICEIFRYYLKTTLTH